MKFARVLGSEIPLFVDGQRVRRFVQTEAHTLLAGLLDIIQMTGQRGATDVACAVMKEVERWEVFADNETIPIGLPPIKVILRRGNG
jgi:hypothetical protein